MPRPKLHSDEAILDAAKSVVKKRGPPEFTLNYVALKVGISRAALIQRFKNRENILHSVMARAVQLTREHVDSMAVERSHSGLHSFLDELCSIMGEGSGFETHLLIAWSEARDPVLKKLSQERFALVRDSLEKRIPAGPAHSPAEGPQLLQCVIGGAAMQWLVESEGRLDAYIRTRVELALSAIFK
jgi:TetR/AcrR family macrolide resistance operon transcriptional repressor